VSNSNIASLGRFSSQMLTYLGTQRTVKIINGVPTNTFKYASGPVAFPNAGSLTQSALGAGVVGSYSPSAYDSTKSFFLSRGVGNLYADTMAALVIDMAAMTGQTPQSLIEKSEINGRLLFSENAYRAFNNLRDPGNQVGMVTSVNNSLSPQARQIRS
jgi:hypothetical protein